METKLFSNMLNHNHNCGEFLKQQRQEKELLKSRFLVVPHLMSYSDSILIEAMSMMMIKFTMTIHYRSIIRDLIATQTLSKVMNQFFGFNSSKG